MALNGEPYTGLGLARMDMVAHACQIAVDSHNRGSMSADFVGGQGPLEARVLAVIRRVLGATVDASPIPVNVELSAVGLDSIRVINLLLELESEFGLTFPDAMLIPATFRTAADVTTALLSLRQMREVDGVCEA